MWIWDGDEMMGLLNVCICYAALGMMTASFAVRLRSRLLQVFGNLVLCVAMVSMIGVTISMVLPKDGKYEAVRDGEIVTYSKIVLFAQTIIGWLVGMCYYISESAMMF